MRFNNVRAAIKLQFRDVDTFIHKDYLHRTDIRYIKKTLDTRMLGRRFRRPGQGHPAGILHSHGDALRREIGGLVLRPGNPHPQDRQFRSQRLVAPGKDRQNEKARDRLHRRQLASRIWTTW